MPSGRNDMTDLGYQDQIRQTTLLIQLGRWLVVRNDTPLESAFDNSSEYVYFERRYDHYRYLENDKNEKYEVMTRGDVYSDTLH